MAIDKQWSEILFDRLRERKRQLALEMNALSEAKGYIFEIKLTSMWDGEKDVMVTTGDFENGIKAAIREYLIVNNRQDVQAFISVNVMFDTGVSLYIGRLSYSLWQADAEEIIRERIENERSELGKPIK